MRSSGEWKCVAGLPGIVSIAAGLRHCGALDRGGRVWLWGAGGRGQLGGSPGERVRHAPALLPGVNTATSIHCGQYFTLVGTQAGKVIGFGDNRHGQLRPGAGAGSVVVESCGTSLSCGWTHTVMLDSEGVVTGWGRDNYHQLAGAGLDNVRKVVAGSEHCLALTLTSPSTLLAWGWNEHGNCGVEGGGEIVERPAPVSLPPNTDRIDDVFAGSAHCFALSLASCD